MIDDLQIAGDQANVDQAIYTELGRSVPCLYKSGSRKARREESASS
jgi:hypothetical protein